MTHVLRFALLGAALLAAPACSKEDPTAPPLPPEPSAAAQAPAPDPWVVKHNLQMAASAAAMPMPAPSAPAPPAPAAASVEEGTAPSPPPPPPKPATCGDKPLPPCPLYTWMKANMSPAMGAEDYDALATALDKAAGFAPHEPREYANWASIAGDGAAAARAQNLDAVKAACRGCHNQYKERYKRELRDRPL